MTAQKKTNQPTIEEPEPNQIARITRLQHAINESEKKRMMRVEQVKAKTGRTDLATAQRKLTQIEAAAYCDVSTATIHRWTKAGLKTVQYGERKRFLIKDLQEYIKKLRGNT